MQALTGAAGYHLMKMPMDGQIYLAVRFYLFGVTAGAGAKNGAGHLGKRR